MEGGQWHSGAYDTEHGYPNEHHATPGQPSPAPAGMKSPTPAMYNPPAASTSTGPFGVFAVLLRVAQILLSLIGFAIMASDKQTFYDLYYNTDYGIVTTLSYTVKFTAVKSYVGLLSLDVIVFFYAIVQLVISLVQKGTQGSFISSPTAGTCMITFIFDLVLALALGAACGAAADSAAFLESDNGTATLNGFCTTYSKFCDKADASVAMSFIAFALLALSAALYPIRLFKALQATKQV